MTIPNLIHRVSVTITQYTSSGGVYDERTKQFVGGIPRNVAYSLEAQPCWKNTFKEGKSPGGSTINAKGYLLFLYIDLIEVGVINDENPNPNVLLNMRLTSIGSRTGCNYYIVGVDDIAHYDESTLVKAWVSDRAPGSPPT